MCSQDIEQNDLRSLTREQSFQSSIIRETSSSSLGKEIISPQKFTEYVTTGPFDVLKVTNKKRYEISYFSTGDIRAMPSQSYTVISEFNIPQNSILITYIRGVIETQKKVKLGDVCICGISGETYVMTFDQFLTNYIRSDGDKYLKVPHTAVPNPNQPRIYAEYRGRDSIKFTSPWGEYMLLTCGDFVVKEILTNCYYRVARTEFLDTYNLEFTV
jgi:hypothetical protein